MRILELVIVSLVVAGLNVVFYVVVLPSRVLPFDRWGRLDRGRFDLPLWSGNCAVARPVTVHLDVPAAAWMATEAMRRMGLTDIVALDAWTAAGWQGFTWRSSGQQVGVHIDPVQPGEVTLWCCSRPRITTAIIGVGASERSAQQLEVPSSWWTG